MASKKVARSVPRTAKGQKSPVPNNYRDGVFNEEMFKGEFSPSDFIEKLCQPLLLQQSSEFDPVPLKDLFDNSLQELVDLASHVESKIEELADECAVADREHRAKVVNLNEQLDKHFSMFKQLDKRIGVVATTAARIGERLESVDQQQKRAEDALSLIKYFMELNNASQERSAIFTDPTQVHNLAHVIKKLSSIAVELDLPTLSKGKMATEIISNSIENELLDQFESAAESKNFEKMKKCAYTLIEFNGGESCIARYIVKLGMFFDVESLNKDDALANNLGKRNVSDPNSVELFKDTRLDEFYADIIQACEKEHKVICKVFPTPSTVMLLLVQRIFEQRVRNFLETMLGLDSSDLPLYLWTLAMAYQKTQTILIQGLKKFSVPGLDFNALLNSIFCNYQDVYIEKEILCLRNIFSEILEKHSEKKNVPINNANNQSSPPPPDPEVTPEQLARNILKFSERALQRASILSHPPDLPSNSRRLFSAVIKYLGYDFLDSTVSASIKLPAPTDPKCIPSIKNFFEVIKTSTLIMGLVQQHFNNVVNPLLIGNVNEVTPCRDTLNALFTSLEGRLSSGLENALSTMISLLEKILGEQKKTDYKFDNEPTQGVEPTKVCLQAQSAIHQHHTLILAGLDGKNLEGFLEEYSARLLSLLMTHFKRFKVSSGAGGLRIMRDLAEYREAVKSFKVASINTSFTILGEIGKIYLINPENLIAVRDEGPLANMDYNDLLTYVKLRDDFKSNWIGKNK
eukprot:TRINITY_DN1070_c0_g2_i4.p1 TRINITY_DN1070_c0_g2~~TRINITY_DN1070_c0_g2_i4.p1  ORF type:complete len:745 (+),score=121.74 TRINITY_DN1070_c0_g2_i4:930-3164(+)